MHNLIHLCKKRMFLIPSDIPENSEDWCIIGSPLPALLPLMVKEFLEKSKKNQRSYFCMMNNYTIAPHYHNMIHLLAQINNAELMRNCIKANATELKAISMKKSPLFYSGPATTNILLGWLTKQS